MKLEIENKRRLVIDVSEDLYYDLELLAGGMKSLMNKIVIDLINQELKSKEQSLNRMKEIEKERLEHLDKLWSKHQLA
jgi:hypothetical protein